MSAENAISIITPFFNQGNLFWDTYQAIINQTFVDWEWIIVNDGSTAPASVAILEKLKVIGDLKIKIITLPQNQGLPAARNAGTRAATSPYVFFLDSDDLIEPDYLEKAWITLELNPSFAFVNSWSTGFGARQYDWRTGLEQKERFLEQNWVAFAGLFKKSVLEEIPFNESKKEGLEDWEFWLASAAKGHWGYTIPERLFHYRIHDNSKKKWKNWDNGKKQKAIQRELKKKYGPSLHKAFPSPEKTLFDGHLPVLPVMQQRSRKDKPLLLVVLPWLGPGGVEQFTRTWMKAMRKDFNYILLTTNFSQENDDKDFKELSQWSIHLAHLADSSLYPALISYIIRSRQPDLVVLSHAEPFYHLLPFITSNFPHTPVIDINHIEDMQWQEGGYPKIASIFSGSIVKHIVVSNWLKDFMQRLGVNKEKIETVYINVDTNAVRPLNEREKTSKRRHYFLAPADHPVIIFSGRLTHQKKVLLLPDIAEMLVKKNIPFHMVICGDGPDREQLEERIYQKRLTRYFQLTGSLSHKEALARIQAADILLLPSAWEGIATVLYEAMAAGLPVIATDVGGQRELVTPDCGQIIQAPNDAELLLKVSGGLQMLIQEPALRAEMGYAARLRVESHFDSTITFAELTRIFNKLIERERGLPEAENHAPSSKHDPSILKNYQDFASGWNILHRDEHRPRWKNNRRLRHLRKIYKVVTGKRSIVYLWKGS